MGVDVKQSFWLSVWTGYVFWSLFTSLPALIWFYPLNELEISGYEAFIVVLLAPFILRSRRLREYLQSDCGDLLLKIFCLIGIASFRCPTTLARLCFLTVGTGAALLKLVCDLTLADVGKKKYAFWGYTVGFMVVLTTRIWYRSIMPTFYDDSTNLLVFVLTFLNIMAAVVTLDYRSPSEIAEKKKKDKDLQEPSSNLISISMGTGSVFYVLHAIFGEVSTPCRWVNGPYPLYPGPEPLPWGLIVYFALLLGFWLSPNIRLIFHPAWSIGGAISFFVMYTAIGWGGFFGALFLAVYVASVWPTYIDLLFRRLPIDKIGPAVALAMITYVFEALYGVWTVAYNFVPGGVYTRESTPILISIVAVSIGFGLYRHQSMASDLSKHLAFTEYGNAVKISSSRVWSALIYSALLATSGMVWRNGAWDPGASVPTTAKNGTNNFTAMIWTYHFGYDNRGWPSLDRTAKLIDNIRADVIGLLETDASRPYMGNNDLAQWLAETLNMYVDFGPNTRKHTWGSILLSKFPILSSQHHLLPSPKGELAPAISALLNISGTPIGVVVTHFGNDVDDEDRKLQAESIAEITSDFYLKNIPSVFLGYVTSKPFSRDYYVLLDRGKMKDIDDGDTERFCEYIFYNRLNRLAYGRISHGGLSDTEIQVAKFKIPESKLMKAVDFRDKHEILEIDDTKLPVEQKLPTTFGGFFNGHYKKEEHHYHMSTPKYFLPSK